MKKRKTPAPCPAWGEIPPGYGRAGMALRRPRAPVGAYLRDETQNGFMRGFLAAGLVAATASETGMSRETLSLALQGGTAMATGIAGANAIDRRDYATALLAVAIGAAGLKAISYALPKVDEKQQNQPAKES